MSHKFESRWERLPKRLQVTFLLIILVVVIGIATFFTMLISGKITSQAATGQASLSVTSGSQNYDVGTIFPLYIWLGADKLDQIKKIQILSLNYDPTVVEVQPIGGVLKVLPENLANLSVTTNSVSLDGSGHQTGKIALSFESPGNIAYTGGSTRLAVINLKVLKADQAIFSFDPYNGENGMGAYVGNVSGSQILVSAATGTILVGGLSTPTPTPTVEPTPTPQDQTTSVPATATATPKTSKRTATPVASVPSDEVTVSPESVVETPTETPEGTIRIGGFSSTAAILIYIGIAVVLTLVAFLIWYMRKRKKVKGGNFKDDDDDDDII